MERKTIFFILIPWAILYMCVLVKLFSLAASYALHLPPSLVFEATRTRYDRAVLAGIMEKAGTLAGAPEEGNKASQDARAASNKPSCKGTLS